MSTTLLRSIPGLPDEMVTVALPRQWRRDGSRPAVIVLPGTGESWDFPLNPVVAQPLIEALTDAGFPVGCATPANQWGNAYSRTWITAVKNYLQTSLGAKAGKIGLVGLSQGGLNALSWAGANPTLTGAVTAYITPPDLEFAASSSGYGSSVDAAYGGDYVEATMGATFNPQTMAEAGKYGSIPIEMVYASNDDVVPFSLPSAFKTAVGASARLVNAGPTGHSWSVTTVAGRREALVAQMRAV